MEASGSDDPNARASSVTSASAWPPSLISAGSTADYSVSDVPGRSGHVAAIKGTYQGQPHS